MSFVPTLLLILLACQDSWKGSWDGECEVDSDDVSVEVTLSSDRWGILRGDIRFEDDVDSYDAELEGTRSGDDLEIEFVIEVEDGAFIGLGEGSVDDDEMELTIEFTGADYSTEATCALDA